MRATKEKSKLMELKTKDENLLNKRKKLKQKMKLHKREKIIKQKKNN
jgi:hypothetical protein